MKQTLLNRQPEAFRRKLRLLEALCVCLAAATAGLNLLLALTYTETTRTAFLLVNILTDALCGAAVVTVCGLLIRPGKKLLSLAAQDGSAFSGTVESVSGGTLRYLDMDCFTVSADGRKLFLPENTICLEQGAFYRFTTVSNVITEAER